MEEPRILKIREKLIKANSRFRKASFIINLLRDELILECERIPTRNALVVMIIAKCGMPARPFR